MINLLLETINDIEKSGHTPEDIIFIGSEQSGHSCNWGEFAILANKVYDDSWGSTEVATDLVIVFKDGQRMWRWEYDGSRGWEYSKPFVKPAQSLPISNVISKDIGGCSLEEMNRDI